MTNAEQAAAFNEWMREYTEDPAAFEATFETVEEFKREAKGGHEPSYGEVCVGVLQTYHRQLKAKPKAKQGRRTKRNRKAA